MELGGAVPSMKTSCSLRFASTLLIPVQIEGFLSAQYIKMRHGCIHSGEGNHTIQLIQRGGDVLHTALAGHWDREGSLKYHFLSAHPVHTSSVVPEQTHLEGLNHGGGRGGSRPMPEGGVS